VKPVSRDHGNRTKHLGAAFEAAQGPQGYGHWSKIMAPFVLFSKRCKKQTRKKKMVCLVFVLFLVACGVVWLFAGFLNGS
jgi:hypothetical protein